LAESPRSIFPVDVNEACPAAVINSESAAGADAAAAAAAAAASEAADAASERALMARASALLKAKAAAAAADATANDVAACEDALDAAADAASSPMRMLASAARAVAAAEEVATAAADRAVAAAARAVAVADAHRAAAVDAMLKRRVARASKAKADASAAFLVAVEAAATADGAAAFERMAEAIPMLSLWDAEPTDKAIVVTRAGVVDVVAKAVVGADDAEVGNVERAAAEKQVKVEPLKQETHSVRRPRVEAPTEYKPSILHSKTDAQAERWAQEVALKREATDIKAVKVAAKDSGPPKGTRAAKLVAPRCRMGERLPAPPRCASPPAAHPPTAPVGGATRIPRRTRRAAFPPSRLDATALPSGPSVAALVADVVPRGREAPPKETREVERMVPTGISSRRRADGGRPAAAYFGACLTGKEQARAEMVASGAICAAASTRDAHPLVVR